MKQAIISADPRFDELTSARQRAAINRLLCGRFGAPPGTEIPYNTVCPIERRGGVYWADLKAEWDRSTLLFNVKWLNKSGEVAFAEGWCLKREGPIDMQVYRGA